MVSLFPGLAVVTAVWESQKNVPECKWDWCYCNSCLTGLFCILQNFLFLLHYFQHVSCIAIVEKYCTFMTVSVVYWLPTVFVAKCILVSEVPNNDSELHLFVSEWGRQKVTKGSLIWKIPLQRLTDFAYSWISEMTVFLSIDFTSFTAYWQIYFPRTVSL